MNAGRIATGVVVGLVVIFALPFLRYGTFVPCEMLREEMVRVSERRFGALATGLVAAQFNDMFRGADQEQCLRALGRLWFRGPPE